MSLLKQLASETAIYGLSSILSRLVNWIILTPYLTRIFQQGEYGVVNDLYTWIALLLVLFTYRMETAFFRYGRQPQEIDRAFATAALSLVSSTLVFSIILLCFSQPIAALLHYTEHPEYVRWFVGIVAMDAIAAIPFARLRLENRPLHFALIKALGIGINIIFLFFLLEICPRLSEAYAGSPFIDWYRTNDKILYVFVANFIASFATVLLLWPQYRRIRVRAVASLFDAQLLRQMILYALPLVLSALAAVVNSLIGIPMLRFLADDATAGIYSAAAKLAVLMNLFTQAFNYAAEPFFFRHADRSDARAIYAQVAQAFALVGSLVFLGIMLYIDIIQYLLGKDFREGLGILPILLFANLLLGLYYSVSIWFKLSDKTTIGGYIAMGGAIITLLINYMFIPHPAVGYYAPAWAALVCYGAMLGACYALGQRYFPVQYPVWRIALYMLLALFFYALDATLLPRLLQHPVWLYVGKTLLLLLYVAWLFHMERGAGGLLRKKI